MKDMKQDTARRRSLAADKIDETMGKVATMLDRLRIDLSAGDGGGQPIRMAAALGGRLEMASARLRASSGEEVVEYAKGRIMRHPTLTTIFAAAVAASVTQFAVTIIRKNERRLTSTHLE